MSSKAINEHYAKQLLQDCFGDFSLLDVHPLLSISSQTCLESLPENSQWLNLTKLVVKPDQLIKRRGKLGLVGVDMEYEEVKEWIKNMRKKIVKVGKTEDYIDKFIVEPYFKHSEESEMYLSIYSTREGDVILFHSQGGIDIGDVESKANRLFVPIFERPSPADISKKLLRNLVDEDKEIVTSFIISLFDFYFKLHFTFIEINPLVINEKTRKIRVLDLAAKLDETAQYQCLKFWGDAQFPAPFGKRAKPEEIFVSELDSKTGASLKLTVLNPKGRIWTLIAGGGASVIYSDTILSLAENFAALGNYGEYSGAPSQALTFKYAKTVIDLMLAAPENSTLAKIDIENNEKIEKIEKNEKNDKINKNDKIDKIDNKGKILLIGGGIANFTNVAETFRGIIKALRESKEKLKTQGVKIFVRRGGPNFQQGLEMMENLGREIEVPIKVFGPETSLTAIVSYALGKTRNFERGDFENREICDNLLQKFDNFGKNSEKFKIGQKFDNFGENSENLIKLGKNVSNLKKNFEENKFKKINGEVKNVENNKNSEFYKIGEKNGENSYSEEQENEENDFLFSNETVSLVFGMHPEAVQNMLDFDYLCRREIPSVACVVYPFASGTFCRQFYFGSKIIKIPIYANLDVALKSHPKITVAVNFASSRSAYESSLKMLKTPQIKVISIVAEGVPERHTKHLIKIAKEYEKIIIGPATVGAIKPGCFRFGNTGGKTDNILASKLYQAGSVAYVSKSGGMSNELNNIISRTCDGVFEGIAIGGDRYPASTFLDFIKRFQKSKGCQMIVLLGEVGGLLEYEVAAAISSGEIAKPVVAWVAGGSAEKFPYDVQFGHAGAFANCRRETAGAKNAALKMAGAIVPDSFDGFELAIKSVFEKLKNEGKIPKRRHFVKPPRIAIDYGWATELGLIRKPPNIVSSIVDFRRDELEYCGVSISKIFEGNFGVGGVIGLLWFRKQIPKYFANFIDMVLIIIADHGPAVSAAHNTIVTARAGKDLISSLVSGLVTIGPRFGGAIDAAARDFWQAFKNGIKPSDFVAKMRTEKKLIMGIGHRKKSLENPDVRVALLKKFALENFVSNDILKYALEVEKITTRKKSNLILNVDGAIGVCMVDCLKSANFSEADIEFYIKKGAFNALFVVGRSIGLVGHYLDQNVLQQPLYRHPTDDIGLMEDVEGAVMV